MGSGDPVVLIHGFPWSSQAWRRIAPCLARDHTVYYFDMLGCGQSDQFEGQNVSPAVQNDLLAALLAYWGLERPQVVGHDFGGLAALRGYYINGLRYTRLVLMNAVAVLPSGSPFFVHVREHEAAFAGLPGYAHEALFRAFAQDAACRAFDEATMERYLEPWRGGVGQPAFYRQIAQSGARCIKEVQERYGPMECPVKLIWGERDERIPISQGESLAACLCADQLIRVPEAGHLIQEDAPEVVLAELLRP
jgi:pimeloyl-ACP methyl ester carboxylesterase